jgi:hypothetical protein
MACRKIFSGDLPEIISDIIQYFRNDFSTLHSCVLVNRLWCRLAIPLLWEDPFSLKYPKNYYYIEVYLHNLNDDDKSQLNEYGISDDLFPSNTLFNYPSFIQYIDTCKISDSIEKWVAAIKTAKIIEHLSDYTDKMNFIKLMYRLLFRIFIENGVNIHTFKAIVLTDEDCEYFNDTYAFIIQNPSFIRNIRNLTLDFDQPNEHISKFMIFLYSSCKSISSLYMLFPSYCYQTTEKHLSQLIDSQQNLNKISFSFNYSFPLYHSLLSLKNSNTLRTIIFCYINFKNIVVLKEVFEQLNGLESIHILYCRSLNSNFTQQIVNLTKPFRLKSLFLNEPLTEPQLLLQKSGEYLENFGLEIELTQEELELYIKYCSPKIRFLKFYAFDDQNIYKIFDLVETVEQSLNYLIIDVLYDDEFSTIVLQNLGQILPSKLEYLSLTLKINTSDFEIFLRNIQNTFIKKLLIKHIRYGDQEEEEKKNILPYIKKYIMKNKKVEYLAFLEYFFIKTLVEDDDLFSLKNEVKEFRLHNIIVQNYNDLNIEICEYIKEMY